jgi:hypothetical protein
MRPLVSAQAADEYADSDTPAVQVTVPLVGADLEKPVMNADVFASYGAGRSQLPRRLLGTHGQPGDAGTRSR